MTPQFFRQRAVWSVVLLVLVGFGGSVWWAWQASGLRAGGERPLEGLGNFGAVPDFSLIERSGRRITRTDLLGFVSVVNFFYTTCPDTCPLQSAGMARLQQDVADLRDLRLVSISVDPHHDTPAVLRAYAQRFAADPERWLFLTGDKGSIYRLAQEGFHLSVVDPERQSRVPQAEPQEGASATRQPLPPHRWAARNTGALLSRVFGPRLAWAHGDFEHTMKLHSARFVLVDRQARIRGYYHSDEAAALQRLRRDIHTLLRER